MTTGAPYPYQPPPERPGGEPPGSGPRSAGSPRRRRAPRLLPLAVAAFALLEIWLLTLLADATDGLVVLAVSAAGAVLGAAAIKRAGRRAWRGLVETVEGLQAGAAPESAARAAGARPGSGRGGHGLAMLGGLLLMLPGLLSDAVGLLCLFPPTAALLRRGIESRLTRRAHLDPGSFGDVLRQARAAEEQAHIRRPGGRVVQGEVVREDTPEDGEQERPGK